MWVDTQWRAVWGPLGSVADVMAGLLSASQASGMFTQWPPRGGPGPEQVTGQQQVVVYLGNIPSLISLLTHVDFLHIPCHVIGFHNIWPFIFILILWT